jgi:hypothetical protein
VIAQVHGVATAAGCQLAATCDLVVAAEEARFATPGVKIGLFCSTPMVALSRAVGAKKAMEMLLTGEFISAREAQAAGLVNRVCPVEGFLAEAQRLAADVASRAPVAVRLAREAVRHGVENTMREGLEVERRNFYLLFDTDPAPARRDDRAALLPALHHHAALAGLVLAAVAPGGALPPVRALEPRLAHRPARLPRPVRARVRPQGPRLGLVVPVRCVRAAVRGHRLAFDERF